MKARIFVTLKNGVLDPQGKAIEGALKSLDIKGISSVRQGKLFEIDFDGSKETVTQAAEKLLANLVVENYQIEYL
jgi:phosphoribosylformylglycinamidine synthase subunit PurS